MRTMRKLPCAATLHIGHESIVCIHIRRREHVLHFSREKTKREIERIQRVSIGNTKLLNKYLIV